MSINLDEVSRTQLEEEYKLSKWALTWALHKLGGTMTITPADMEDFNVTGRIYYSQAPDAEMRGVITTVEFKEQEPVEESRIILPGTH